MGQMREIMIKRILRIGLSISLLIICAVIICYITVSINAYKRTFDSVAEVPQHEFGLLLATSPITRTGVHNFYFDNRINAAAQLYHAGKIKKIIASGGDYTKLQKNGCDEPKAIRDSLIAKGIPSEKIILDYKGTRTLHSIENAIKIYKLDSVILISQKYHNERAIFQADYLGLKAIGYNAESSPILRSRIKNTLREFLARVKLFIDITLD